MRGAPIGRVPQGQRIYAIGDIHGRLDLLDTLLARIDDDDSARPASDTHIIFLGDLIDRGPNSAQVVQRCLEIHQRLPATRFLLGNHEEVFLQAMSGDLKALAFFNRIGGRETILSYGVSEAEYKGSDYAELHGLLQQRVPADHIAFVGRFEDMIIFGDYAFVHAGVRPGEPLARQRPSDLRWIRDEFLDHDGILEKIVVHGHTISADVELARHRIGLDTGAYAGGKLTAMGFEGGDRWVLQTTS
ncbi:MAG: metallophosphoesterase family protein [Sphingomonas sp.]